MFQEYYNSLADVFLYSRALHSAAFSLIGAVGFIASAALPAQHYAVSTPPSLTVYTR